MYNGSFYYHERDSPNILKFDLVSERYTGNFVVPMLSTKNEIFLYTTGINYIDFSVDDNGLWIIYGVPNTNNTAVIKVIYIHSIFLAYI